MAFTCKACTFLNEHGGPVCQMCGSSAASEHVAPPSNPANTATTAQQNNKCSTCTFVNQACATKCAMCGNPLQNEAAEAKRVQEQLWILKRIEEQKTRAAAARKQARKQEEKKRQIEEGKQTAKQQDNGDLVDILQRALTLQQPHQAHALLTRLYDSYVPTYADGERDDRPAPPEECAVCSSSFEDEDEDTQRMRMSLCGHQGCCQGCFRQYVHFRVADEDVLPCVHCPEPDCRVRVAARDFVTAAVPPRTVCALVVAHISKLLQREEEWVPCRESSCRFGFLVPDASHPSPAPAHKDSKKGSKKRRSWVPSFSFGSGSGGGAGGSAGAGGGAPGVAREMCCGVCNTKQRVERKQAELDDEFKKMIEEGKLRPCPKCTHLTMKEYGVCNVLECAKCSIWWNWRSRETGNSSRELKHRARGRGSLWEPGELAYQQKLEYIDPPAFKALLERNGVQYNPNYRRGT